MPGLEPGIQSGRFGTVALDCRVRPGNDELRGAAAVTEACYVYIMASDRNGTIYIGVTSDLARRAYEHREGRSGGFTKRYGVKSLVHYEAFDSIAAAIQRETSLKRWPRKWKLDLIEKDNPRWRDLYEDLNH